MKIALVVPGGVDHSGEVRVIPALLALIRRVSAGHELHVFATHQEDAPGTWQLEGAQIHNIGLPRTPWRALRSIFAKLLRLLIVRNEVLYRLRFFGRSPLPAQLGYLLLI